MALLVQPPLPLDEVVVVGELVERIRLDGSTVVVEVGGNAGRSWAERLGVGHWHSVDPVNAPGTGGRVTTWPATGEAMPLGDGVADVVLSCNAFQFVDVAGVLADALRVLRPGGALYAHFGPIWSGPDGHQLEYVEYRGRPLQFWEDTLLPPYAHLRYGREELRTLLRSALPADLADVVVEHVHASSTINRLFVEDYVDLIRSSGFALRELAVSDHLDYVIDPPPYDRDLLGPDPDLEQLGARTACDRHDRHVLGPRDLRILLQKPGH